MPETSASPFQMSRANYRIHAARAISPIRFAPQVYQMISVVFKAVNNGVSAEEKFTLGLPVHVRKFNGKRWFWQRCGFGDYVLQPFQCVHQWEMLWLPGSFEASPAVVNDGGVDGKSFQRNDVGAAPHYGSGCISPSEVSLGEMNSTAGLSMRP